MSIIYLGLDVHKESIAIAVLFLWAVMQPLDPVATA